MVKIRMKMMGRRHRRFFRICAMDSHEPRDGNAIEELGTYDPMIRETEKRYSINKERVEYWLSVGAQPSDKVMVLLRKLGINLPERKKKKLEPATKVSAKKK